MTVGDHPSNWRKPRFVEESAVDAGGSAVALKVFAGAVKIGL